MKRSPDERHTVRTHGNLTDMFRHSQRCFTIRREYMYVNIEWRWRHITISTKSHQEMEQEEARSGSDGGKIEFKLSEVNTRTMSWGQNELIREFKMAAGDLISIGVDYELHARSNSNLTFKYEQLKMEKRILSSRIHCQTSRIYKRNG